MAKVIYSVPITQLIGSIGGTTYQSNNSGFIARSKPFNVKRRRNTQANHINSFVRLSQLYRNLSLADKSLWTAFAVANPHVTLWNDIRIADGLNWFCIINNIRARYGDVVTNIPLGVNAPFPTPVITATITNTDILLDSAVPISDASERVMIWATSPLASTTGTPRKSFRSLYSVFGNLVLPLNIAPVWELTFGLTVNDSLFVPGNGVIIAVTKCKIGSEIPIPFTFARS